MSVAITNTHNTMGVRTLKGAPPPSMRPHRRKGGYIVLGAMGSAPDPDTLNELAAGGYDPGMLQTFVALGATNEQLQALPYPASSDEIAAASQQLMAALTHSATPTENAITATADIGALQAQANDLVSKVQQMQQELSTMTQQALAASRAGTPWSATAGQMLNQQQQDLNSIISQVNNVYRAAFGTVAPGLSGLGVDPVTIAAAAAAVTVILAAIAAWWNHEQTLKAQIAVQQTQANTQQQVAAAAAAAAQQHLQNQKQLLDLAAAADAAGNPTLAAQYRNQAAQEGAAAGQSMQQAGTVGTGGPATAQIGAFFQQYWPYFALGAGALVLLPMLTGKRR